MLFIDSKLSEVFPAGDRSRAAGRRLRSTRQTGPVIWCFWRPVSINLRLWTGQSKKPLEDSEKNSEQIFVNLWRQN